MSHELTSKLKSQPKAVELLGEFVWDNIVCRPIEAGVQNAEFYTIVDEFYELVTAKTIPTTDSALRRLSKVFQMSASDQVMSLIDPDSIKFYEQPAAYYLHFYRLVAEAIKTRDDVKSSVEKELTALIDQCIRANRFVDELQPGGLTVFYFIGLAYTVTVLANNTYNTQLVEKIISMWFNVNKASADTICLFAIFLISL